MKMRSQQPSMGMTEIASQQPSMGMTEIASQQPRRGMTGVASRFNGWDKGDGGMRAVGTRPATASCRVPKGTLSIVAADIPAIEMAGYLCLMPTASALRSLRKLNK